MQYRIWADGSFDLLGEWLALPGCYPCTDGTPLRAKRVETTEDGITYFLREGEIELHFGIEKCGRLGIACQYKGLDAPHDLSPFRSVGIEGAEKAFVQGFGMEGPSGTFSLEDTIPESFGLTALYREDHVLLAYAEDHTRFTTSFRIDQKERAASTGPALEARINLERTTGRAAALPTLYLEEAEGLSSGLRRTAERIAAAMQARPVREPAFFWSSWYHAYETMDQQTLEATLQGIAEAQAPFQYIELDAGYTPHLGDWLIPNHHWPGGLELAARTIREAGYRPGIWVGPFIVGDRSALYREHPDWVLHDREGKPFVQLRSYTEPKMWGNPDCDYYVLDTSHPAALAYVKEVFQTLKRWGFSFFKADFLLWNMQDSSSVRRFRSDRTSVEVLRDTMKAIREAIGEESFLLGCIAPFMPMIGCADGMRLAGDCGAQWKEPFGPVNMLRELPCDNYFHQVFWQNDPDAMLLRDFDTLLNGEEVRSLALLQALSGGMVSTSDPIHRLGADRRELLRLIEPKVRITPELPYFGEERKELLLTHRLPQGNLLFVMNPTEEALTVFCRMSELFGEGNWYQYRYHWGEDAEAASRYEDVFAERLAPHAAALLFVTREPLCQKPTNLWDW